MASFISFENQTLLWNTMQNVPIFKEVIHISNQSIWFKKVIGEIYEQNKYRDLVSADLNNLNKSTISHMINLLKSSKYHEEQEYNMQQQRQQTSENFNRNSLEMRQKEYNEMLEVKMPEAPNFKEANSDEPIVNMEELIKKHQQARELDVKNTSPINNDEINDLKDKISNLENIIEKMSKEMEDLKKNVLSINLGQSVNELINKVESTSSEEN